MVTGLRIPHGYGLLEELESPPAKIHTEIKQEKY